MKPYYESGGITIYCGDCREILPALPQADLLLTDPPYGIGQDGERPSTSSHGGRKGYAFGGWDAAPPDGDTFRLLFSAARNQIIWGGNYFAPHLPASMGWLIWDKGQRIAQSDAELAYTSFQRALRVFTLNRAEIARDGAVHPAQKPLQLMLWCITYAGEKDSRTIIDPFMGSGTTLRAAKDFGRQAIGIEREEKFCEIAVRRLAQENLFSAESTSTAPSAKAPGLFG